MSSWTALPTGQDLSITPGGTYAAVASVGASTTKDKVASAMAQYFSGTTLVSYVEQGQPGGPESDPDSSRKTIGVVVSSQSFSGSLAWSKGIFLIAPNIYTLVAAWALSGSGSPPPPPWAGLVGPFSKPGNPWGWVFGLSLCAGLGFGLYHYRDHLPRLMPPRIHP